MPPKKDGKKKLSKAEKERLKKEEAERKAREEEEARLRELEERRLAKKRQKFEASERKKLENEERRMRKAEMSELMELIEANKLLLREKDNVRRKRAKWDRYMRCDGSPNPAIPGEINTYINLCLEDTERDDDISVLKDAELDLELIKELQQLIAEEEDPDEAERYNETIKELQNLIDTKLDRATLWVLCNASQLQDSETNNLQHVAKNSAIYLCLWGNLSLVSRIKQFEFHQKGFCFDIPRFLALTSCAIRVLFTQFDHLSHTSKAIIPRRKKKEEKVLPEEEILEEKTVVMEETEEGNGEVRVEKEESQDMMAQLLSLEQESAPEEEEEKKDEEEEEVVEDFEDLPSPEPPEWDDFDEEDDIVDLRAYQVLGEVFKFELLVLPPQPTVVKTWTITKLVDPPMLERMEYVVTLNAPANDKKDAKETDEKKKDEKPPITVTLRLPVGVCFMEEPTLARWDEKKKFWRTDGFAPLDPNFYKEVERTVKFTTYTFGTMALLQDLHINMPFQSWEIRPHTTNAAVLTIIAAIIEVEIEIKNGMCCLSKPSDKPELSDIVGTWVTPDNLITMMQRAGINLFPAEDSSKYVNIQEKQPLVEERAYEQMALTASAVAFSWSKWNGEVKDREKIFFQAAETLEDEPVLEEDRVIFMVTKRRAMKLKMTEFDEEFSEEIAENTEFRSNLYHLMHKTLSPQAWQRVLETKTEFVDCVEKLISSTKLLTFS